MKKIIFLLITASFVAVASLAYFYHGNEVYSATIRVQATSGDKSIDKTVNAFCFRDRWVRVMESRAGGLSFNDVWQPGVLRCLPVGDVIQSSRGEILFITQFPLSEEFGIGSTFEFPKKSSNISHFEQINGWLVQDHKIFQPLWQFMYKSPEQESWFHKIDPGYKITADDLGKVNIVCNDEHILDDIHVTYEISQDYKIISNNELKAMSDDLSSILQGYVLPPTNTCK